MSKVGWWGPEPDDPVPPTTFRQGVYIVLFAPIWVPALVGILGCIALNWIYSRTFCQLCRGREARGAWEVWLHRR